MGSSNYRNLSCRFYKNKFPEIDDVVMVSIRHIADMGAYVDLLEYNNMEGMILLSELSRRRIRSINKLIKVGKQECVLVIRVDKDKGYIDLSKRRVSPEEIKLCEDRFMKAKTVMSIVRHASESLKLLDNEAFEDFVARTVWVLNDSYKGKGGSFEAFKQVLFNPAILDECNLTQEENRVLSNSIRCRLEPKKVKIRADIEVNCFHYGGVDSVKDALSYGIAASDDEGKISVKINLIAPPIYVVTILTFEREKGMEVIKQALERIESRMLEHKGSFKIKMEPKIVSEVDEAELSLKMSDLERINAEIDGDEESSEYSEEEYVDRRKLTSNNQEEKTDDSDEDEAAKKISKQLAELKVIKDKGDTY